MIEYIIKAATAWFLGFFPYIEIYVAVPAAIGLGLDYVSAVFWSVCGNFSAVPIVVVFYNQLLRIKRVRAWLDARTSERYQKALDRYGPWFVLLMTPLVGIWIVAVMAKAAGMNQVSLFISSFVSVLVYAVAIAVLIAFGVDIATGQNT